MSSKLDQTLEDIVKSGRANHKGGRGRKPRQSGGIGGPSNGISKSRPAPRPSKPVTASAPAAPQVVAYKILVSNLPSDVSEQQIKDYFGTTIGPVKRVLINYRSDGASSGSASIIFAKAESAPMAAQQLNGVKVDGKPIKIELIYSAAAATISAGKSLGDRVAARPKPATDGNRKSNPPTGPKRPNAAKGPNGPNGPKGGRNGRGKNADGAPKKTKKTSDELDAEMVDYFQTGDGGAAQASNGNANKGNGSTAPVEDEIM